MLRQNPVNVTPIQNLAVFQKQKLIFRENARIWTRNVLNHHSAIKVTEKDREAISLSRQVVGETSNFSLNCSAFQTLEAKCDIAVLELEKIYQISVASGVFCQILNHLIQKSWIQINFEEFTFIIWNTRFFWRVPFFPTPTTFEPIFDISTEAASWLAEVGDGLSEIQLFQYFTTFFPEMHNVIDF